MFQWNIPLRNNFLDDLTLWCFQIIAVFELVVNFWLNQWHEQRQKGFFGGVCLEGIIIQAIPFGFATG